MAETHRSQVRRCGSIALAVAACLAALLACGQDRAGSHLKRAQGYLDAEQYQEASVELRSALAADPESADANRMLGNLSSATGRFDEAIAYYREAHRLDPRDAQVAINYAGLIRSSRPKLATQIIADLAAQQPANPISWIGLAEQALAQGDGAGALEAALKAVEVAPADPNAHWEVAYVRRVFLRDAAQRGEAAAKANLEGAATALHEYIELGGERPWRAHLELARVYAIWPGHEREAASEFRSAVELASTHAIAPGTHAEALNELVHFSSSIRDPELHGWALERVLEVRPDNFEAWESLARLRERHGGSATAVYEQMVEQLPESGDAHVRYARHLIRTRGYRAAVAYLEEKIAEGVARPRLLGTLANLQYAGRKPEQAAATIERMAREFPDDPRTKLEQAQQLLREHKPGEATAALIAFTNGPENDLTDEALRLLAGAQLGLGDLEGASAAIDRAIALEPGFSEELQALRARIQAAAEQHPELLNTLRGLEKRRDLRPDEELMRARAYYATEAPIRGRRTLLRLVTVAPPHLEAVAEFAKRERHNKQLRQLLKRSLERGLAVDMSRLKLLGPLVSIHVEEGDYPRAEQRIELAMRRPGSSKPTRARLHLMRAQLHVGQGDLARARTDARRAFELQPQLPGAASLLAALYHCDEDGERTGAGALHALDLKAESGTLAPSHVALRTRLERLAREEESLEGVVARAVEQGAAAGETTAEGIALGHAMTRLERSLRLSNLAIDEQPNAGDSMVNVTMRSALHRTAVSRFQREVAGLGMSKEALQQTFARVGTALFQDEADLATFRAALAMPLEGERPPGVTPLDPSS